MSSTEATGQAQAGAPSIATATSTAHQPQPAQGQDLHASSSSGDGLRCEWQGCGDQLPTAELLYEHVCERHVGRKSTNNLNLTCAWGSCRTTTVKRDHITSHIRVHVPLKPHKCEFCQKAFKRPQDLKKHVKTHAEDPNFHSSPDQARGGHHGQGGVFGGQAKPSGYYPDNSHMSSSGPVYPPYGNGTAGNPSAYHGPSSHYQANYMTTLYPVSSSAMNAEYEVRKKATYDALNEFFGDLKNRSLDTGVYQAVGQRLMNLQSLPNIAGNTDYGNGTAVATASHHPPLSSHYTLPLSNLRTKTDLTNVDQFLEQLQATVYEHETASQAAAAGVAHHGTHYIHPAVNYRSSHSPPHGNTSSHAAASSHVLPPPLTSTAAETPALTPASSVVSYNSPSSVHSSTISPVSRASGTSLYPTLPSVTVPDVGSSYHATSSAVPSALATSFDPEARRRFSSGILQRARSEESSDSLPRIDKLGVRSPSLANVDPALYEEDESTPRVQSPVDPAISGATEGKSNGNASEDPDWIVKVRVLESIRTYVKTRLENGLFEEDGEHAAKQETEAEKEARSLYPVLRAVQEEA